MRLACGICKARSPEFGDRIEAFTWTCGACMRKNTWTPPKPKKKEKIQDVELEITETLEDLVEEIGEDYAKEEI